MKSPEIDQPKQSLTQESPPGYTAARETCAFFAFPDPDVLQISGPDRLDFLQRQTTNDLKMLTPGHILTTILTSATGRVLDVLTLLNLPGQDPEAGAYLAITLPGTGKQTAEFLQKKIFFMDRVTVENVSTGYRLFSLVGPETDRTLAASQLPPAPRGSEICQGEQNGSSIWMFSNPAPGSRVQMVAPTEAAAELSLRLKQAGSVPLDTRTAEILRVESGLPGIEGELNGDFTPLETNLAWAISSTKGCYTGQEVIARQITYDKVTRQLVGLMLAAKAEVGDPIWVEGKAVGAVTSFAVSPVDGPLALAVLKRPHHQPGTRVLVGDPAAGEEGEVHALPFSLES